MVPAAVSVPETVPASEPLLERSGPQLGTLHAPAQACPGARAAGSACHCACASGWVAKRARPRILLSVSL